MGQRKEFPRVDLSIPSVECTRDATGAVVIPLNVVPPATTLIRFPAENNASSYRSFDMARWYGGGIDEVTYACQRQLERYLSTHDGDLTVATIVGYATNGVGRFLNYLMVLAAAQGRTIGLDDINRDIIDGYLDFLNDGKNSTGSQRHFFDSIKSVLTALGRRGLIRLIDACSDEDTFPRNPFPNSARHAKGQKPLPKADRRAFTAAVKTAVMPLFAEGVELSRQLLAYAMAIVALHTGRNLTPLLEMDVDCLRPHPKDNVQFLVLYKRRGNSVSKVVVRDDKFLQVVPAVLPTVVRLIRRVIELTAPLRADAPEHLKNRLWLYRSQSLANFGAITALREGPFKTAINLLIRNAGLMGVEGKPLRMSVSRLRKTFANRIYEILDGDLATTALALGNTPKVAASDYMRPGEDARKNWKFMGLALTKELLKSTLGASERTPAGRCSDTKQGEYAPKNGATCTSFLDCIRCRNYVVTGDDLYRLFSFYWLVVRERARVDKRKWQQHFGHILRLIDQDIVEVGISKRVFTQSQIDAAKERAQTDPHPFWASADILKEISP